MKFDEDTSWRGESRPLANSWWHAQVNRFAAMEHAAQQRRAMLLDALLCIVATWIALALRLGFLAVPFEHFALVCLIALPAWVVVARLRGIYQSVLRYTGGRTMFGLLIAGIMLSAVMTVIVLILRVDGLPRTIAVLQPMTFVAMLGAARLFVRFVLIDLVGEEGGEGRTNVLIYGARRAGQQLALSMRHESAVRVIAYIDDDTSLHGQYLDGVRVHPPEDLGKLMSRETIHEVLLAMPKLGRSRRKEIIDAIIAEHPVAVRSLPSTAKILAGEVSINDLRPVSIHDLLGRDAVAADPSLLSQNITGKRVLITGAGGSIGSELCRQLLASRPRTLALVEISEFALYQIYQELKPVAEELGVELVDYLVDVADRSAAQRAFSRIRPETVFHAAAYKHVPIVERNVVSGLLNNVFGTLECCLAAEATGVESFTLISTDKAVRPTNVMGASKRVAEMILQSRAAERTITRYSMVRFGNVLGSSGSVVPLFQSQISAGGPITLTDSEVTRYFMTIPEASQLVIQAGALAEGGDVFVLDMGEPVRIYDLARSMIELSGLEVRNEANPDGDIEIIEVGLRAGEKKYEELLIGENPLPTIHPRIIKAHEEFLPLQELVVQLDRLRDLIDLDDSDGIRALLMELVPNFKPAGGRNGA